MQRVGVIGAGTMGHGIAQVCAMAGYGVVLCDANGAVLEAGLANIRANLHKGVDRGKVTADVMTLALDNLAGGDLRTACVEADIVIEAVPEILELKRSVLASVAAVAAPTCILATNTSSLSIASIASGLDDPGRLIGTHFFNPVHIMPLLEIVVSADTRPEVLATALAFGERIGKTVITVNDHPGFVTSRLGICLGMEAIRMVEQGVATPEAIDTAMMLGYRHPIGPLRLTDLVGLDIRMHVGEYLAKELSNPAFKPPALLREMIADGKLGKKSGEGFYHW